MITLDPDRAAKRGLAISFLTLDTLIKMAKPAEAGTELENILYETGQLFDLLLVTKRLVNLRSRRRCVHVAGGLPLCYDTFPEVAMSTSILCDYCKNPESPPTEENRQHFASWFGRDSEGKEITLARVHRECAQAWVKTNGGTEVTKDEPPHVEWRV
jgi:hypothetical protein